MNIEFRYRPDKKYPWSWYYSPQGKEYPEVMLWCYDTYGQPVKNDRWDCHGGWIYFADRKDAEWFTIKWS